MKEFMLQFKEGQEYLITAKKLRWRYEHGIMNGKYRKTVDRELTVRQFEIIRGNPDNGHYSFFYNGERQCNISIDVASDPNLVIIKCYDRFPGYEDGHAAYQSLPYDAKGKYLNSQGSHRGVLGQSRACLSFVWALVDNGQLIKRTRRPGTGNVMVGTGKETHPRRPILTRGRRAGGYHLVGLSIRYPHNPSNTDLSVIEAFLHRLCAFVERLNPSKAEVRIDNGKPFSTRYLAAL